MRKGGDMASPMSEIRQSVIRAMGGIPFGAYGRSYELLEGRKSALGRHIKRTKRKIQKVLPSHRKKSSVN